MRQGRCSRRSGYTLMELMVAVVLLGIVGLSFSYLFSTAQRGTALAVYSMGVPLGTFVGNLVGGQVGGEWGWRAAFYVLGIPGLLLAVYVAFAFREPPRGHSDGGIKGVASTSGDKPLKQANFPPGMEGFTGAATYAAWVFEYNLTVTGISAPFAVPSPKAAP